MLKTKKLNKILSIGAIIVLLMVTSSVAVAEECHSPSDVIADTSTDSSNITALIVGGPGYFIRVSNPKNVTIIADITVNVTTTLAGSAEYMHELSVSPGHSNVVYKIGGMPTCIFGQISAEVSVDSNVIASRSGFLILGIIVIFIT